ncbi:P protein [Drosophila kikkawai]|uniref:P protein n=1 Tax=Drosophila kikkawai TaxID=30033 RepID=A0A6P4HL82_DROKI|nr:P protein [Drosophila kikkawai]
MVLLLLIWAFFAVVLIVWPPRQSEISVVTVLPNEILDLHLEPPNDAVRVILQGPIYPELHNAEDVPMVGVRVEWRDLGMNQTIHRTAMWNVYLLKEPDGYDETAKLFHIDNRERSGLEAVVSLEGKCDTPVPLAMIIYTSPIGPNITLIFAGLLVVGFYILIFFELTDHTFAAILMANTGLAMLTVLGNRPTLETIISWVDIETLMLLIGMMIIVGITSETGLFDWLAILSYRISKGYAWPLVFFLALMTAVMSSVLDNVTMLLLMAPIAIRLCEAVKVQTPLVLLVVVMYSNFGGALTPVGDPPNVIISTNKDVVKAGISFPVFVMHMLPGVVVSLLMATLVVYLTMRKKMFVLSKEQIRASTKRESMRPRLTEQVAARATLIQDRHPRKPCIKPADNYFETLAYLQTYFGIQDKPLLVKCLIAMTLVVAGFLMHPLPFMSGGSLGWVSILGAFLLIILARLENVKAALMHVEWAALIFLSALFVLVEEVDRLGLIHWLSEQTVALIGSADQRYQTMVAILLILWISGILAAIVGNVPVTTMMLKLILRLVNSDKISVPLSPLVWALSFGACYGANGTLFGSTANIVGAAVAKQYGYHITFLQFFRYGFPMTIVSLLLISAYLLIAHTVFTWHDT